MPITPDDEGADVRLTANDARMGRLKEARREKGFKSVAKAAQALDLPESTWRSHENGSRDITEDAAYLYGARLLVNFEWLWNGTGEMRAPQTILPTPNAKNEPREIVAGSRTLPIVGRAKGGVEGDIVLDGTITDHIPCPRSLEEVAEAYGLEVLGSSMEPRYFAGEIVYVHPTRAVHPNAHVVLQVRGEDGELRAYVKRFRAYKPDAVIVTQYNPPEDIRFERDSVEAIHLIVQSSIR